MTAARIECQHAFTAYGRSSTDIARSLAWLACNSLVNRLGATVAQNGTVHCMILLQVLIRRLPVVALYERCSSLATLAWRAMTVVNSDQGNFVMPSGRT